MQPVKIFTDREIFTPYIHRSKSKKEPKKHKTHKKKKKIKNFGKFYTFLKTANYDTVRFAEEISIEDYFKKSVELRTWLSDEVKLPV